ncbi:protein kinase domain-containing protein [Adlercreutzia sp. ZJ141]|uniref:protein kinase domain-containing protein n=1 Tax=Adlercreutzia sp. ZJ141 TaxID=2709406 RepID=UPI0013EBB966|nr:hypothetical protein [Adlercreutzia sp. ZJ141]
MGSRMYQYEKIPRVPLEGSASAEGCVTLAFEDFSCTNVKVLSEDGASGIVYEAVSKDFYHSEGMPSARLIVKECYPVKIADRLRREKGVLSLSPEADEDDVLYFNRFLKQYKDAFSSHAALYQSSAREQIVVPDKSYSLNGTQYLVSDASNGDTMTFAFERMSLKDKIKTLVRVCEAITAIHEAGYVYLDLKPDNILCVKNSDASSNRLYTGEIKLFDFDTATKISDLSKADTLIFGSGGWSAHEQTHEGYRDKIGPRSDIYSIGALLFWIAVGRPPKSNEVIHADGKWPISGRDCSNAELIRADERALQCVRHILNSTLTVDPALRYSTTKPLIDDLSILGDLILPVGPTHATDHMAMRAELENLATSISEVKALLESSRGAVDSTPNTSESEAESVGTGFGDAADMIAPADVDIIESDLSDGNPAVVGYAVYQILTSLTDNFEYDIQDDIRAVLSSTAAKIKDVLSARSADESEDLFEVATEMANSVLHLLVCNMALDMPEYYHVPAKVTRICKSVLSSLSHATAEKDVDEMLRYCADAVRCTYATQLLAVAGSIRGNLSKYLSDIYLAAFDDATNNVVSALEGADAEKIDAAVEGLERCTHATQLLAAAESTRESLGEYFSDSYLVAIDDAVDNVVFVLEGVDVEKIDAAVEGLNRILAQANENAMAGMISRQLDD